MKTDLPSTKVCVHCKKEFSRRLRESHMKWKYRIYCGIQCVHDFQRKFAEKNRQLIKAGKPPLDIKDAHADKRDPEFKLIKEPARVEEARDLSERIEFAVREAEQKHQSARAGAAGPVCPFHGQSDSV